MAQRPLLLPPLVLLLLAAGMLVAEASESQNRMKLCGRDFVRTIIFICGSSRWKRSSMAGQADVEEPDEPDPDWESIEGATKDLTKGWPSVFGMPQPRKGRHASPEMGGLSKYCCRKGCTMKDISNYC